MQAILTKAIMPTATRGMRIKATAARGSITLPAEDARLPQAFAVHHEETHAAAAQALLDGFYLQDIHAHGPEDRHWLHGARLASGCLPNGDWCHVIVFNSQS